MAEIVVNRRFSGFGLSEKAMLAYAARKGITLFPKRDGLITTYWTCEPDKAKMKDCAYYSENTLDELDIARDDADLVAVVRSLGKAANGIGTDLAVVEVPDGVDWEISKHDDSEHVAEKHRT